MSEPISELRSVTCHMGSHSVTCHPTEVNAPRLNPSQMSRYSIYLPRRDGRLSWPRRLVTSRDDLPAHRPICIRYSLWRTKPMQTLKQVVVSTGPTGWRPAIAKGRYSHNPTIDGTNG